MVATITSDEAIELAARLTACVRRLTIENASLRDQLRSIAVQTAVDAVDAADRRGRDPVLSPHCEVY